MISEKLSLVMLTDGGPNGRQLSRLLADAGVEFEIVTFAYPAPRRGKKTLLAHLGRRIVKFVKSVRLLRAISQRALPRFPTRPRYVGYCNGERMLETLRKLSPDYIIMMGGCILSPECIRIARHGVLNAHPGILPWARGMDVLEHSLLRRIPLGATCHYIDAGIDTGPILVRYLLPVSGESDTHALNAGLTRLTISMMLEVVLQLWRGVEFKPEPQSASFPYCKRVSASELQEAKKLIESGLPRELYLTWLKDPLGIPDGTSTLRAAFK